MAQLFGISGCEAKIDCFHRTQLAEHCSPVHKHAMYLYYALKKLSHQDGHTYVKRQRLEHEAGIVRSTFRPKSQDIGIAPSPVNWSEALEFLEEWRVIVRENNGMDIYLYRYWNAEKMIAEAFHTLRKRHEADPWIFEIDPEQYVSFMYAFIVFQSLSQSHLF